MKLTGNIVAVAHYLNQNLDNDEDGTPDWYEQYLFGTLDTNQTYDGDLDGFSLKEEREYGLVATIKDEIAEGGISIRRSKMTFMNFGGAKKLIIKSDPPGLVASSTTYPETNSSYTSINLSGSSNGYVFSHWEVNGVRQSDPKGVGLSRLNEILNEDKTLLAKYYPENEDSDSDGIPDWYEWREFGTLSHSENSDPDGDGISIARERQFGLSGVIDDNISEGGVSIRRSSLTFMNFGGAKKVTVKSNPPGLINSTTSYPETNSTFTSSNLNGTNNGYVFSHWEVNGVRQADDKGIGLSRVIEILNEDKNLLAKYYPANEDTDSDGIQDWYEWREFGTLIYDGKSDPDGDGFTIARERQFGLSGVIDDNISEGGVCIVWIKP